MTAGGQSRIELLQGTLYFRAMSIRVLRGRDFAGSDDAATTPVAIISVSVARKLSQTVPRIA
jgi:hypothetical protein